MAKRRLSKTQARRIKQKQVSFVNKADTKEAMALSDAELGTEQSGRVIAHYGSQVDVETKDQEVVRCFLRANLGSIVTGDHVVWCKGDTLGVVVSCKERKSLLNRPDSYGKLKPVAANVEQILVTIAPKPEAHTNLIDRYLVIAEINDICPIILINKADLITPENTSKFTALANLYRNLGYDVIYTSAKGQQGLDSLKDALLGKTSIFVGQSGVGKSSLIQQLMPEKTVLVGSLSESRAKGKHTTTYSQLFHFAEGGECIDSPGIREFGLWHLDREDVIGGFVEIRDVAQHCRYRNCQHKQEPGCAVLQAIKDGNISQTRFDSYQRIIASLDDVDVKPLI